MRVLGMRPVGKHGEELVDLNDAFVAAAKSPLPSLPAPVASPTAAVGETLAES